MLTNVLLFLIEVSFNLYLYVVVLRLLLQTALIHFANPFAQFAGKYTQPMIGPLQKVFPVFRGIDLAVLMFALGLEMVKFFLLAVFGSHSLPSADGLLLLSVADLLRHFSTFYFYIILFSIILRLVALLRYNTLVFTINQLTQPLLRPMRRIVPIVNGFDLSALVVLVLLQLFEIVVVRYLMDVGRGLV
jgi:YggT family protein